MRRLLILGNCLAERLAVLLEPALASFRSAASDRQAWEIVRCNPVYNIKCQDELEALADTASECDLVFSQPLFNFGRLNTSNLRKSLGARLHTFSAPNFEAYFPDVMDIRPYTEPEKFPAPLEWHSSVIVACKAAGVPVHEVEAIYHNHPIFRRNFVAAKIAESMSRYEKRDKDVEISTLEFVKTNFKKEPLFHTFNHPSDPLLRLILNEILKHLSLPKKTCDDIITHIPWQDNSATGSWSYWGFGFNSWPIITRHHNLFDFKERDGFRVSGKDIDITTCAIAYYNYYDAHPLIFEQALAGARSKGNGNGTKN